MKNFDVASSPSVRLAIFYHDGLCRDRAGRLFERFARPLSSEIPVYGSWWRLDSLQHPKILHMAAEAVRKADVILFAVGSDLPGFIKEWIAETLNRGRFAQKRLLVLLEADEMLREPVSAVRDFFGKMASHSGIDFCAKPGREEEVRVCEFSSPATQSDDLFCARYRGSE